MYIYITKLHHFKQGLDDGRVAFIGEIKPVPKEEAAAARETYLARHPGHFWVRVCVCFFVLCLICGAVMMVVECRSVGGLGGVSLLLLFLSQSPCRAALSRPYIIHTHTRTNQVDFGDFDFFRLETIKAVRYNGGFARFGALEPEGTCLCFKYIYTCIHIYVYLYSVEVQTWE